VAVAYPRSAADKVEPAVTRTVKKVVGEAEATTSRPSRPRSPTRSRGWPPKEAAADTHAKTDEPRLGLRGEAVSRSVSVSQPILRIGGVL
jgi:hypothetical protein